MLRLPGSIVVALALAAGALVGCSSARPAGTGALGPASPATTRLPVPAAPHRGACYRLDVAAALQLSSSLPPVSCMQAHTSVTVSVRTFNPVVGGHRLAIDSAPLQRTIARTCQQAVDLYVGGSLEVHRLSRVQAVWFSPTPAQTDLGARWYRCDLVIADGATAFASLPGHTRGLLATRNALDRYGTCGTAAPGSVGFGRVTCSQRHSWRARSTITLPAGAPYLGPRAGKVADSACRDVEVRRAIRSTHLRWSFEWPTHAQWTAGQRYGLCWTPGP